MKATHIIDSLGKIKQIMTAKKKQLTKNTIGNISGTLKEIILQACLILE